MAVLIHLLIVAVGISLIAAVSDQTNGSILLENDKMSEFSTQYHEKCTASLHIHVAFEVLNQSVLLSTSPLFAVVRPELFSSLQYYLLGPKGACDILGLPYTYCVRDFSCEVNLTTTDYMTLVQKVSRDHDGPCWFSLENKKSRSTLTVAKQIRTILLGNKKLYSES